MPRSMQAIIFDFDGLIFDTETLEFEACQRLYRQHDLEMPLETWQHAVGTWDALDMWEPWRHLPETELQAFQHQHHRQLMDTLAQAPLRAGIPELLEEAKQAGLRLAVASSSDQTWIDRWLGHHEIAHYFECTATRYEVEKVKPDPALYRLAIQKLQLPVHQLIALEDSLNGFRAATAAGLCCIAVPNPVTQFLPFPSDAPRLDGFSGGLAEIHTVFEQRVQKNLF